VPIPEYLVCTANEFKSVIHILKILDVCFIVADSKYLSHHKDEELECVECLFTMIVDEPLLQILIHSEHIWQERNEIKVPL